jgi:uncharacterized repeat protein (TIGR03803 family)
MQRKQPFFRILCGAPAVTFIVGMLVVPAFAQNASQAAAHNNVPPTARQAAQLPEFASRLARQVTPAATHKRRASTRACSNQPSPQDNVIYENGPVNGTTDGWTINFGFVVSDTLFVPIGPSIITGFDFYAWEFPGDMLASLQWSITSSPNGGAVYGSGTVSGANLVDSFISTNQYGYNIDHISASGLNVTLTSSGTYWVNLFNAGVPSGNPVYWDENSGQGCQSQGCPSQAYENSLGTIPSEAFEITGNESVFPCFSEGSWVIHDFNGLDGNSPYGVVTDKAGNLYGATDPVNDNGSGNGSAYKLALKDQTWMFTPLYSFTGLDNGVDSSTPVVGPEGVLYGTAEGGIQNCGTGNKYYCGLIYSLAPSPVACLTALCSWTENVLYRFTGNDASGPGSLVFDPAGNLYGIVSSGGAFGNGAVFELTPSSGGWSEKLIYSFIGGSGGSLPDTVLLGNDGNLYGTTSLGGAYGWGAIFQLVPSQDGWSENVIYSFQNQNDGFEPYALVQDNSGDLFGIAYDVDSQYSTLFMLTPSNGTWVFTTLEDLAGGYYSPNNLWSLTVDKTGKNLYGFGHGEHRNCDGKLTDIVSYIFSLVPTNNGWKLGTPLLIDDQWFNAYGALATDANGNLYGTTYDCGKYGDGTVWMFSP